MQNLSNYTVAQLRKLDGQVAEELKKRHYLGIIEAREQILHIARNAGISVDDLISGKAFRSPKSNSAPIKYRHPEDPGLQWSGRGHRPAWVKEWIASGKSIDEAKA